MSEMSSGKDAALRQLLVNYANDDDVTTSEVVSSISALLGYGEPTPTLRDQFAMAALNGLFAASFDEFWTDLTVENKTAQQCYKWADAMMKERR